MRGEAPSGGKLMAKDFGVEYGPREEEAPFFECCRCGREWEGEPSHVGPPNPSDGIADEWCEDCERKERQWEEAMGLIDGSEDGE